MGSNAIKFCTVNHLFFLFDSQQDYNDPEGGIISKYYFPGKVHELEKIIAKRSVHFDSDVLPAIPRYLFSDFIWPHNYGIFTGVNFTVINTYYYSNASI